MREILFRGECTETGDWVKGFYVRLHDDKGNESHRIYRGYAETDCGDYYPDCYEVDPATVGQFTGLTDKNGKKIFEGDILQYSIEEDQAVFVGAVKFGEFNPDGGALLTTNVGFYVEMVDQEGQRTYMRKDIGFWVKFRQVEVIGNIHDNPELLEVTDNA